MIKPSFSIIIPTYNSSQTLPRCLESILSQKYFNYEIWLIDGLSEDNTIEIINGYTEKYAFIHFISEPDKGLYDAMNKGIQLSSGNWLYFLGSDDTLYNEDVLMHIAEKIKLSKTEIIYGNVFMTGANPWNLDGKVFAGEYNLERILNTTISHQAIFFNRIVFEKFGNYDLKYNVNADYDFLLRCSANTALTYIDLIVANYSFGGYSTTAKEDRFNIDRGALFLKYYKHRIFTRTFLGSRLYLQRAALSSKSPLNIWNRIYSLLAYIKLKIEDILSNVFS